MATKQDWWNVVKRDKLSSRKEEHGSCCCVDLHSLAGWLVGSIQRGACDLTSSTYPSAGILLKSLMFAIITPDKFSLIEA